MRPSSNHLELIEVYTPWDRVLLASRITYFHILDMHFEDSEASRSSNGQSPLLLFEVESNDSVVNSGGHKCKFLTRLKDLLTWYSNGSYFSYLIFRSLPLSI